MSEPAPDRDPPNAPAAQAPHPPAASRPRWVTLIAIAAAVLFVGVIIVLHLTGAVGPGAH